MYTHGLFQKVKNGFSLFFDRDKSKLVLHPYRDWMTVFFFSVLLCLFLVGVGVYFFVEVNKGDIFIVGEAEPAQTTINSSLLHGVVEANKERKQIYDDLLLSRPQIVDPSL